MNQTKPISLLLSTLILSFSLAFLSSCSAPPPKKAEENVSAVKEMPPSPPTPDAEEVQADKPAKTRTHKPGNDRIKKPGKGQINRPSAVVVEPLRTEKTLADYIKEFSGEVPISEKETAKEAAKLMEGRVSYSITDTIKVGEAFTATVMISDTAMLENRLVQEIMSISHSAGESVRKEDIKLAQIKIAEIMRAELTDPSDGENFTIKPNNFQEQHLLDENNMNVVFQWTIVPKKAGNFPLILNLFAVFFSGDKEVIQNIPVFKEKIFVENVPDNSWMKYAFSGLIAAIISGLFVYFRPRVAAAKVESIIEKIGEGETAEAIKMLQAKKLSNTNENLLVNHLAEFNDIRRQFNGGMIERADMQMVVNRIHNSMLEICNELQA